MIDSRPEIVTVLYICIFSLSLPPLFYLVFFLSLLSLQSANFLIFAEAKPSAMAFVQSLLSIVSLASVVAGTVFQTSVFTADADSPFNGQVVNAAGGAFYLGLPKPGTFCPDPTQCPGGTTTLFAGMNALWVEVPGGQQVYVAESGAISFTIAHSLLPPDVAQGAFTNTTVVSDCAAPFNVFNWKSSEASGTGGILVCPVNLPGTTTASHQIYAKSPSFSWTNCTEVIGLLPLVTSSQDFGAFEYA